MLRGKRFTLVTLGVAVLANALAFVLPGGAALIPAVLAIMIGALSVLAPLGDLAQDKLLGHLEFDRTLPISLPVMATGRLLGAAIRTLPFTLCVIALFVGLVRSEGPPPIAELFAFGLIPIVVQLLAWLALWLLLGLNARWSFVRLWWIPTTIGFLPQILLSALPPSAERAVSDWFTRLGHWLAGLFDTVWGPWLLLGAIAFFALGTFCLSVLLFTSGMARYTYNPLAVMRLLAKAPTREMGAAGRGPAIAIARLRLRVATEQFRRELIVLGVLFIAAAFGPEGLRHFARGYIPVLAGLLPAGIAFQLMATRASGEFEGMRHLPHPPSTIGLGHLVAIAVMAIPGAVVLMVLRLVNHETPSLQDAAGMWAWLTTIAWCGTVLGVWLRPRYVVIVIALGVFAMAAVGGIWGESGLDLLRTLIDGYKTLRATLGTALPLLMGLLSVLIGLPLFAMALRRDPPQTA